MKWMLSLMGLLWSCAAVGQVNWEALVAKSDSQPVVVVFLDTECPLSRNYTSPLKTLPAAFPSAHFVACYSGSFVLLQEVTAFEAMYQFHWPACVDTNLNMARAAGATITPEAVVLHRGRVVYRGAIDDWSVQLGKTKGTPTHFWLHEVLQAIQSKSVVPAHQPAIGCRINL